MPNAAENLHRKPVVCYVTDGNSLGAKDRVRNVLERVRAAVQTGVDWVQIREKSLPARELLFLARDAVDAGRELRPGEARVVVNDRLDVAIASGAAGVHLGGESLPAREVTGWCRGGNAPADFSVGASCHSVEQAHEAENAGANYIFFGPIFDTPSKRAFGSPQGIPKLAEVCREVRIPVIAIGGINLENTEECLRAGAAGIAAIRLFQDAGEAADLRSTVERIHRMASSDS